MHCQNPTCHLKPQISVEDNTAKLSKVPNRYICKTCKIDEIGADEQDDFDVVEAGLINHSIKSVASVKRNASGQMDFSADVYEHLGIDDSK